MYAWKNNHQFLVVENSLAAWLAWLARRALILKQKPYMANSVTRMRGCQRSAASARVVRKRYCGEIVFCTSGF
jgi:hypothetical protein